MDPIEQAMQAVGLDVFDTTRRQTLTHVAHMWTYTGVRPMTITGPDGEHTFTAQELALMLAVEFVAMRDE